MKPRSIEVDGTIAIVPLTMGYVAIIDAADREFVAPHNWTVMIGKRADGTIKYLYAYRKSKKSEGVPRTILLHRFLMGEPEGILIDHRDRDGLNCRKSNLRTATISQNGCNQGLRSNNTSGFKGVSRERRTDKWVAQIAHKSEQVYLGTHSTLEAAARAYSDASKRLHGDFGRVA